MGRRLEVGIDEEPERSTEGNRQQDFKPFPPRREQGKLGRGDGVLLGCRARADDVTETALDVAGPALECPDELLLSVFVGDQNGGRVHASRRIVQLAAKRGRYFIHGAVDVHVLADANKNGGASRGKACHMQRWLGSRSTE